MSNFYKLYYKKPCKNDTQNLIKSHFSQITVQQNRAIAKLSIYELHSMFIIYVLYLYIYVNMWVCSANSGTGPLGCTLGFIVWLWSKQMSHTQSPHLYNTEITVPEITKCWCNARIAQQITVLKSCSCVLYLCCIVKAMINKKKKIVDFPCLWVGTT